MTRDQDPWLLTSQAIEQARRRKLEQVQPGALQYAALMPLIKGECPGCGASWTAHPMQNALAKGADECAYCRRPRR